ncbi:hypothetical protein J7I93_10345 [Bacillus sp. ISL-47]|uniref:hypothetical protein n=1 Tax=Bacillus sp. ISL-47 TaxID=2819130 RepID=UPI001BED2624|nr:hypothetical protein [Bacillus sp. ISL-47]MBT2688584.1 hypothetical protein [Bacillus sp. ISL-47]MBT2708882.1 hypothetical protein [Pseudomonas sp. ISL-84]
MTLKSIELQVAIPRTIEAGKLQEQLQQRGQTMGGIAAEKTRRDEEKHRSTVIKQEQKQNVNLSKEDKNNRKGRDEPDQKEKQKKDSSKEQSHPFKGQLIDYSG